MNYSEANWLYSLAISGAIGGLGGILRIVQGDIAAPGVAWSAFWFLATAIPLILAPEFKVSPSAVGSIWMFALYIGVSSCLVLGKRRRILVDRRRAPELVLQRTILCAASVAACFAALSMLRTQGFALSDVIGIDQVERAAKALSSHRYSGETEPVPVRAAMVVVYIGGLVGGRYFAVRQSIRRFSLAILPVACVLGFALITTAKASLLFCAILWSASWLATRIAIRGHSPVRFTPKVLLIVAGSFACLFVVFLAAMRLRYGEPDLADRAFIAIRMKEYLVAHLSVFSSWWEYTDAAGYTLQWGQSSFFGVADHLGFAERKAGGYDFISQPGYIADSNVFSIYRAAIEDFSLPGALAIAGALAAVASVAFRTAAYSGYGPIRHVVLTAFYAILLCSHVVNLFGYTSLLAAFLAFGVLETTSHLAAAKTRHAVPHLSSGRCSHTTGSHERHLGTAS